jgi:enoyl-CoA hydratase/carnithine racemase
MGEYLGITGTRMGPEDAIYSGFADVYVPQLKWGDLIAALVETGDPAVIDAATETPPTGTLRSIEPQVAAHFGGERLGDIVNSLRAEDSDFTSGALKALSRGSPLSMACTVEMVHRLRTPETGIRDALGLEYRFTYRAMDEGDFLEGIRAAIIDKDRAPNWQHALEGLPGTAVAVMLKPLGADALTFEREGTT